MARKHLALLLATALPLAGCSVGPDYHARSATDLGVPDSYSVTANQQAQEDRTRWWGKFDDPMLAALVDQGRTANLDVAQAVTRLRQARESLAQSRASLLPQITGSAGYSRNVTVAGQNLSGQNDSFSIGADASYQVDLFGGVRRGIEASSATYQATGFNYASVLISVEGEIARNYVLARLAQAQLANARDSLAIQDDNLEIAGFRVQAGLVSSLDGEQARAARAQTAATIPSIEASYNSFVSRLGVLTGQAPGALKAQMEAVRPIPKGPTSVATGIPAETLRQRPDVRAAERNLAAATAQIGVAQAQLYPALSIGGSLNSGGGALGNLFDAITGRLFAGIAQTIFDGGRLHSQVRSQQAAADGAFAAYKQTVLTGLEDVENAVVALDAAQQRAKQFAIAYEAANNSAILSRMQYRSGLTDFTTLNQAESALLSARNGLSQSQADQATALIQLYLALGGGWDSTSIPEAPMANDPNLTEFLGEKPVPVWRRYLKYIIGVPVLLVLLFLLSRCVFGGAGATEYATQEVQRGNLTVTVSATGKLAPTNQVQVGSELSGLVTKVVVDVNDRVTKGQPLALIDPSRFEDAVTQSAAALNAAKAQVGQAQATLQQDRAQLSRLQEVSRLSGGRVPAKAELDTAIATVARDSAGVRAAQANVVSAQAALSSNQTQLTKTVIRSPVNGVVLARQIDEGQTVAASFSTPTLFVIAEDLSAMELQVAIDEADVGSVQQGQGATFTVDAFPGKTFPATITRVDVGSNLSAQSTTAAASTTSAQVVSYAATLSVSNPELQLRPGMTATAEIITKSRPNVLLVPNAALRFSPAVPQAASTSSGIASAIVPSRPRRGGDREKAAGGERTGQQTVYVLGDDGKPQPVKVTTGDTNGTVTEVTGGDLKPGMKVITGQLASGSSGKSGGGQRRQGGGSGGAGGQSGGQRGSGG